MRRFALLAVLLLLPASARSEGTPSPDSTMTAPSPPGDSMKESPGAAAEPGAPPPQGPRPRSRYRGLDSALVDSLRKGGYILLFRHGQTDWRERDVDLSGTADRSAQRNLSEEGRRIMTGVGKAVAALRIPIGNVTASPMWRCRDTATLAFGHTDTTGALFQRGPEFKQQRVELLGRKPAAGTNDVLVTHQDVLLPIFGLLREELGEGEALVVHPLGAGKFKVLAQATPAQWDSLAAHAVRGEHARKAKPAAKPSAKSAASAEPKAKTKTEPPPAGSR